MNIKSLLLGSAAALVAVSGARAADAVVIAEPEPMEYVRICDTYGTDFYYIPGTETCLKVGGYLRYDIAGGEFFEMTSRTGDETYFKRARAQLRLDARSETELGTLRSYAAINFNYDTGGAGATFDANDNLGIDHAYIELGGFRIGKTDSLFSTFTDYSSGVLTDGIVGYGPFATNQIAYTWTGGNGFSAAIALEEGDENESAIIDSYMPHVAGGVSYTQGWGKVGVVAGYDSNLEELAIKGRLDVNATEQLSLFIMAGYSTNDADGGLNDGVFRRDAYATWGGDFAVWGGGAYKLNDKATINGEIGYDDNENFSVAANVAYELVPGLTITPEVVYADNFDIDDSDAFGARIRFQRNF